MTLDKRAGTVVFRSNWLGGDFTQSLSELKALSRVFGGSVLDEHRHRWYIIPPDMDTLDPSAESLRLSEHYRQTADGELLALARVESELTDIARHALMSEIS